MTHVTAHGVKVAAAPRGVDDILSAGAVAFVADLVSRFRGRIDRALHERVARKGSALGFREETRAIREGSWTVATLPSDLLDRRVEITGPVDRKMVINALNSGANVFMADFEDATAPTWDNLIHGQQNLFEAVRRTITFVDPSKGRRYELAARPATLLVRPRGLHLPEAHFVVDGVAAPGCLVDFGLYFFHNASELCARGTGPYFYLPKLEHADEAAIWNDVFVAAQEALGIPIGTIKATVLIETLPAAFQMHEILHALKDHAAGLNCGRWDYIFSTIKTRQHEPEFILPDRAAVTMEQPMMRAYTTLLVQTCHRRGAFAMGGMAAQIPIKNDPAANDAALAKVRADKLREVKDGHDGTWVAHPALVPIAREVFDQHMSGPNQLQVLRPDVAASAADLLAVPSGERTVEGLRQNIRVGIRYLAAWLTGQGCVPLFNLMEDAATAEISRSQVWQWIRHQADVGGAPLDAARVRSVVVEEMDALRDELGEDAFRRGRFDEARALFESMATRDTLDDFLTLEAYPLLREPVPES